MNKIGLSRLEGGLKRTAGLGAGSNDAQESRVLVLEGE
jgi:hypothetical protein